MKQVVNALVWSDGRVYVCHDNETPALVEYNNPYMDTENAVQIEMVVEVPDKQFQVA